MQVFVQIDPVAKITQDLGINKAGKVQYFVTNEINRYMEEYMPFLTGAFIKGKYIANPTTIEVVGAQAGYLYFGNKMRDEHGRGPFKNKDGEWRYRIGSHLHAIDEPLNYTKTKNPKAGPYWDKRMMAEKQNTIVRETERYAGGLK